MVSGPGHALLWDWSAPPVLAHPEGKSQTSSCGEGAGVVVI